MKICSKCKEEKSLDNFYKTGRNREYFMGLCKKCHNKKVYTKIKSSPKKYQEKLNTNRQWRNGVNYYQKRNYKSYYEKNRKKILAYQRKLRKEQRDNLSDTYIKKRICHKSNLSYKDIPQTLIELKRKQLMIKRELEQTA